MLTHSAVVERIARHSRRPATRPGPDVISLSSGDPDFNTPPHIRRALIDAIENGYTHYADNQGDPDLRDALAAQLTAIAPDPFSSSEVAITHGGSGAVAAAIIATVNPADRVLLPEPTYSLYADLVRFVGAEPVYVRQSVDFHLDLEALRHSARDARLVALCHPSNPTGVVYRRDELEALADIAEEHDLLVLSDEAYDHIVYPGTEFVSTLTISSLRKRLLYCQTFSKTYAMTGWRVGYLAAPPEIAGAAARVHRTINGAMNAAVQRAALSAVTTASAWPTKMCQEYQARRDLALDLLVDVPGVEVNVPDGTFYLFIRSAVGASSDTMLATALEHGVAIRGGNEYGPSGEGFIRVAFSSPREGLQEGMSRLGSMFTAIAESSR